MMIRLSLLVVASFLSLYAAQLTVGAESPPPGAIRDGLLLVLAAVTLFAGAAVDTLPHRRPVPARRWSRATAISFGAGVALGLAGCGLVAVLPAGPLQNAGWAVWAAGLLVATFAALWPGAPASYASPAFRWGRDAAGRFVRLALGSAPSTADPAAAPNVGAPSLWLAGLLAVAALARLWRLTEVPAACTGWECRLGLSLLAGEPLAAAAGGAGHSLAWLARMAFWLTGDGILSLRLAGALLGIAGVVAFYGAIRHYASSAGALLGVALLAFSPWHLQASRTADPWLAPALAATVALWAAASAARGRDQRRWALAGLAFGWLAAECGPFWPAAAPWAAVAAAAGFIALQRQARDPWRNGATIGIGALLAVTAALPALLVAASVPAGQAPPPVPGGGLPIAPWTAALGVLGIGLLVRWLHRSRAQVALGGLLLFGAALAHTAGSASALAALPMAALGATLAADQLLIVFQATWRSLIRPQRAAAWALTGAILLAAGGALALLSSLDTAWAGAGNAANVAMARYLAERRQAGDAGLFFVPRELAADPTVQLLLGGLEDDPQVRSLDPVRDLPYPGTPAGDLVYLTPADNRALRALLARTYPGAEVALEGRAGGDDPLFAVYRVPRQAVIDSQGLAGYAYTPADVAAGAGQTVDLPAGALAFDWAHAPPLDRPFNAEWAGVLLAPEAGAYTFRVDGWPDGAAADLFSLWLDSEVILDTSLGITEKRKALAQGAHTLALSYRTTGEPRSFTVTWQPPGEGPAAIPREVLHRPALPVTGLLGTYYAGREFAGTVLAVRKDPWVHVDLDLPAPFSVRWQGKLAAPRAGEFFLAALADGLVQILVDGRLVVDQQPAAAGDAAAGDAEGSIYLEIGWHDIEVRFAPDGESTELQLFWQLPGSAPLPLEGAFLAPVSSELYPSDLALPAPPLLADARLGDDQFALSYAVDLRSPVVVIPPQQLPPLLLEPVWQTAAGCGGGPGQLNRPHGLAIDPSRRLIHVADTDNRRVAVYTLEGQPADPWEHPAFVEPFAVRMGLDGLPLLLDSVAQQFFRLDVASAIVEPLPMQTGLYRPRGFSVDRAGNLVVADTGGGRVVVLNGQGQTLWEYGGPDSGLGRGQPVDTLAVGDAIWAVTAEDGRLWQIEIGGSLGATARATTLDGPRLAGLPDGSFFLTDPVRRTLFYHHATGRPVREFAYPGALLLPVGVAVAVVDGHVYLAITDGAACSLSLWRTSIAGLLAPL